MALKTKRRGVDDLFWWHLFVLLCASVLFSMLLILGSISYVVVDGDSQKVNDIEKKEMEV